MLFAMLGLGPFSSYVKLCFFSPLLQQSMAKEDRFLALLRGINVGGKNIIAKDDLKACFEDIGCGSVKTYIQSGNILFRSPEKPLKQLITTVENGLAQRFDYQARAIVIPYAKYKSAVASTPEDWGKVDSHKHNALFTLQGVTPVSILKKMKPPKLDIEQVSIGPGVLFWSVSKEHQTKSTMLKFASTPEYQQVTVRNHNTVFKLLQLFEQI